MSEQYWNDRCSHCYTYKGEQFYTITPVPYYYARRKKIIYMLERIVDKFYINKILDVGCGDGEYVYRLCKKYPEKEIHGIDISDKMIRQAEDRCSGEKVRFFTDMQDIAGKYDMAYTICVLAHIDDKDVNQLLKDMYNQLEEGGIICLCEQVAPNERAGNGWKRRTSDQYVKMIKNAGFVLDKKYNYRIDFAVHRLLFERHIAKWFYEKKKVDNEEYFRQECNKDRLFVTISRLLTFLSFHRMKRTLNGWGYVFLCGKKKVH